MAWETGRPTVDGIDTMDAAIGAVDAKAVEAALLAHPSIADSVVLTRTTPAGDRLCVAYLVALTSGLRADVDRYLQSVLPGSQPIEQVHVSAIPRRISGAADEDALSALPILTRGAIALCEENVRALAGAAEVSAVVRDYEPPRRPLHLSDIVAAPVGDNQTIASESSLTRTPARTNEGVDAPRVPAIVDGGPCTVGAGSPATMPESLMRAAQRFGSQTLVYIQPDGSEIVQTYLELLEQAQRICGGLRAAGVKAGDKILFQLDRVDDFIAAFWGCTLAGAVPVPVTIVPVYDGSNGGAAKLRHAWQLLDDPLILTTASLAPAIRAFCDREQMNGARVAAIEDARLHAPDHRGHPAAADDVALIMLTSGSTGAPKCVLLTHGNLIGMSAGVQQKNGFSDRDVTLNWMAMDHVAGIVMSHQRDVFLGCRQIHAPSDLVLQRPITWLDWLDRFRVTITFAPNFAYGLMNRCAEEVAAGKWDLSSVRSILNAGEAVVARTARRFLTLLAPHGLSPAAMIPVWGMSETSSGVTFSDTFSVQTTGDDDPFVLVGRPIPGFAMRIVDDADTVVDEDTIGRLQVKGATVTSGYYKRPELNQQTFTADGWFNTGDLALIRNGELAITGRAKDDVVINGVKYHSHEIESVVDEMDVVAASFTAACGVRRPGADTEELALFYVPSSGDQALAAPLTREIRHRVSARIGVTPSYVIAVEREEIPKTAIGKIQRAQLRERFEAGAFDVRIKQHDLLMENANTLPDWFFRTVWRPKPLRALAAIDAAVVVLGDQAGFAAAIGQALDARRITCVTVTPGTAFERIDSGSYRVRPSEPEDYARLVAQLSADSVDARHFVHAWAYDTPASDAAGERDRGLTSVLFLAQALASRESAAGCVLTVATSRTYLVNAGDEIDPARTAVAGLLRTIEQESPTVRTRHVDFQAHDAAVDAAHLLDELAALDRDAETAYRDGGRWVSRLERLDLAHAEMRPLPFKAGGMYLLTGGLGGVGVEIGSLLLKRFAARLLVIGRTPVPEHSAPDETSITAERRASLQALRMAAAGGGAVHYEVADVDDPARIGDAVAAAKRRWACDFDGIIHLAGVFKDRLLDEETAESFAQTLAPKLAGALALDRVLTEQQGRLFISFGSVTGILGRVGGAAYAAANSFQDAFTRVQRRRGIDAYCLAWSAWDDVGMIRGYPATSGQASGYFALSKTQGLNSFLAVLHAGEPVAFIGVDARSAAVRARVVGECHSVERIHVKASGDAVLPRDVTVGDPFGRPIVCVVEQAQAGDRRSAAAFRPRAAVAPRTEMERIVAQTWQEILNIADADVHSTFFELGGSSLLFARVYAKLRQRVEAEISMTEMFRYPTIGALASHLAGLDVGESGHVARDRDRGRERRLKLQRAKRPSPTAS